MLRFLRLLNPWRTLRLERDAAKLAQVALRLAFCTGELARFVAADQTHIDSADLSLRGLTEMLQDARRLLESGKAMEAKMVLDRLLILIDDAVRFAA